MRMPGVEGLGLRERRSRSAVGGSAEGIDVLCVRQQSLLGNQISIRYQPRVCPGLRRDSHSANDSVRLPVMGLGWVVVDLREEFWEKEGVEPSDLWRHNEQTTRPVRLYKTEENAARQPMMKYR